MSYFLVVYDRAAGRLLESREFAQAEYEQATNARLAREAAEREHSNIEVVLLGAESLEAAKRTHSRYFGIKVDDLASKLPEQA